IYCSIPLLRLRLQVVDAMVWWSAGVLPEIERHRQLMRVGIHRKRLRNLVGTHIRNFADKLSLVFTPLRFSLDAGRIVLYLLAIGRNPRFYAVAVRNNSRRFALRDRHAIGHCHDVLHRLTHAAHIVRIAAARPAAPPAKTAAAKAAATATAA